MPKPVRRIVTGHNAAGRSVFLTDGPAPNHLPALFSPKALGTPLWITDRAPASNRSDKFCRVGFFLIDANPLA